MGVQNVVAKVDSRLVVNQINGSYIAKEQSMIQYPKKTKTLISNFKKFSIEQVPRSKNKKVDALSKITFTNFTHLTKQVLVEVLKEKSIKEKESLADVEEEGYSWITPLLEYLMDGTLPAKTKRAWAIKIKSRQYAVIGGVLYRKSFLKPWLRYVGPLQAEYVVREIHEGSCSMHSGPSTTIKTSNGDTPFSLTYGMEFVIPVEIRMPSLSKVRMEKYYNTKVHSTTFRPGDFVYCSNEAIHAKEDGKLSPKWEGPYEVVEALRKGAYKIRNKD
ncbi:reverse transcriptase domain-containing protein [Tanacetum coccineum]